LKFYELSIELALGSRQVLLRFEECFRGSFNESINLLKDSFPLTQEIVFWLYAVQLYHLLFHSERSRWLFMVSFLRSELSFWALKRLLHVVVHHVMIFSVL
jgi:hypothetical protein